MHESDTEVTGWLQEWQAGDSVARDRVLARLYHELKRLARAALRQHSGHDTLQTTALVNEALLKFVGSRAPQVNDRSHFCSVVARAMRQILIDRARHKSAQKRDAGDSLLSLDVLTEADLQLNVQEPTQLLELDDLLEQLSTLDPRAADVVSLRVFAGMTIAETAEAMGLHPSAVNRDWAHAVEWLREQIEA
ncbi:hypothetical protein C7S18_05790 [Ahniella affigens]|uniref:RNA polymerase sigma-70 ECF-like HTH domain-containing protein n=1 Tax=Ahniella affigens TaxID=2021234 RepID=A0A2P1PPH2_9GAMM|nr:ECF-type sigma factor [Ahniella affigens]AVP96739.1 hypothetical protein C7S18_05790 [Ahniella affigens]